MRSVIPVRLCTYVRFCDVGTISVVHYEVLGTMFHANILCINASQMSKCALI